MWKSLLLHVKVTFAACGRLKLSGLSLRTVVGEFESVERMAAVNGNNKRRSGNILLSWVMQ
jgi:hypothetical protein